MPIVDDPDVRRSRARFGREQGEYWTKIYAEDFAKLPDGTAIVINVVSGEYVTGPDKLTTHDMYDQRFGFGNTISWSFVKGEPIFVGGGLWRSSSDRSINS